MSQKHSMEPSTTAPGAAPDEHLSEANGKANSLEGASLESCGAALVDKRLAMSSATAATPQVCDLKGADAKQGDTPISATRSEAKTAQLSPTALQDMFLNGLRREHIDVVIYCCDGSQERGAVRAFDTFTILLENRSSGKVQLIYKHAISRIFPTRPPSHLLAPERPGKK